MNWYDIFDKETIDDIKQNQDNLEKLLEIVNELCDRNYTLGYKNGYGEGLNETNIIC